MANEINHRHSATGATLYAVIRKPGGTYWSTAGTPNFETLTVANWGNYDIALTESPASSYHYFGTFPAISGNMVAGWYWVDLYLQDGASPAIDDAQVASYFGYWDGTSFRWWSSDAVAVNGTLQTPGDVVAMISMIGSGTGSASNYAVSQDNASTPIKSVSAVGTQAGTYANTLANDGTVHSIASVGNAIDWVYGFNVGAARAASKIVLRANMGAVGDTVTVQAYNFVTPGWDTRTTITGTTETTYDIPLLAGHTGTGADVGKVYIRFLFSEGDAGTLVIDEAYVQAQQSGSLVGYQDGLIWVDTSDSNTNTVPYVDGTADNPVSTIAAAYSLATATGLKGIRFASGSSVTLTASAANWRFTGSAVIGLGAGTVSIADALFRDAYTVSGVATGDDARFINCGIGTCTLEHCYFDGCSFKGTLTLNAGDEYYLHNCYDAVSSGTTQITYAAGAEVMARNWRGGLQVNGMAAGDTLILDGAGRLIIDASCTGGSITLRGHFPLPTGAAAFVTAGGTITQTSRSDTDNPTNWNAAWDTEVQSECTDALNAYDPPTNTEMEARTLAAADYFAPSSDSVKLDATTGWGGSALPTIPGAAPTAASVADAVWDEATADHVAAGSFGKLLADLVTSISGLPTSTAAIALAVWAYASRTLTQTVAQVVAAVSGERLTIEQGYDFDVTLTGLTIPVYTKIWFSVKVNKGDADTAAWLHLEATASPLASALKYVYGGAPTAGTNGTLTIDRVAGTVRVFVKAIETKKIVTANRQLVYDVKVLAATGDLDKLTEGDAKSVLGITLDTD